MELTAHIAAKIERENSEGVRQYYLQTVITVDEHDVQEMQGGGASVALPTDEETFNHSRVGNALHFVLDKD